MKNILFLFHPLNFLMTFFRPCSRTTTHRSVDHQWAMDHRL